jgi:hypothetical protein
MWIALVFILSSKIYKIEDLQELYGLPVLGDINENGAKKKVFAFVDGWLDSIRYRGRLTHDEQMELAVSNICVSLKRDGVKNVFVTSSCHFSDKERADIDALVSRITDSGIDTVYSENIMRNVAAFETMAATGHVIIAERPGVSRYEDIEKELILCAEQGASVLGILGIVA